jgi:hypothetical protein
MSSPRSLKMIWGKRGTSTRARCLELQQALAARGLAAYGVDGKVLLSPTAQISDVLALNLGRRADGPHAPQHVGSCELTSAIQVAVEQRQGLGAGPARLPKRPASLCPRELALHQIGR